jgi:chemotaxis protein CheX
MTVLSTEEVVQLTQEIWSALLAPQGTPQLELDDLPGYEVLATTDITGEWNGTVCVACSRAAARRVTSVMFEIPDEDLGETDVRDAVGELVNVVGGNIKGLLPGPTVLSLPKVVEGGELSLPPHLELAQEVRFSWMAEPVLVSVWTDTSAG